MDSELIKHLKNKLFVDFEVIHGSNLYIFDNENNFDFVVYSNMLTVEGILQELDECIYPDLLHYNAPSEEEYKFYQMIENSVLSYIRINKINNIIK